MRSPDRRQTRALAALCAAFVAFFAFVKRRQLLFFQAGGFDSAQYDQALWSTWHGRFLETSLHGAPISIIALHATFFHALLTPFYALFPSPATLSLVQLALFAAAAFPLYWAARERLGAWAGLAVAAAFLLNPWVGLCALNGYYATRIFPVPFLIAALWAAGEDRLDLLALFSALAASCDEATAVVVAGLGVFVALFTRHRRPGWALAAAAAAYYALDFAWLQPRFGSTDPLGPLELSAGGAPASLAWLASYVATHPAALLANLWQARKAAFLLRLLGPLALTPLLAPSWLLPAAPVAFVTLMLTPRFLLDESAPAWAALFLPFVFFAAIHGLAKLGRTPRALALAAVLALSLAASAKSWTDRGLPMLLAPPPGRARIAAGFRELIASIPPDASVAATDEALPFLVRRQAAYALLPKGLGYEPDYVLLQDGVVSAQLQSADPPASYAELEAGLRRGGRYRLEREAGPFKLWRRAAR